MVNQATLFTLPQSLPLTYPCPTLPTDLGVHHDGEGQVLRVWIFCFTIWV